MLCSPLKFETASLSLGEDGYGKLGLAEGFFASSKFFPRCFQILSLYRPPRGGRVFRRRRDLRRTTSSSSSAPAATLPPSRRRRWGSKPPVSRSEELSAALLYPLQVKYASNFNVPSRSKR